MLQKGVSTQLYDIFGFLALSGKITVRNLNDLDQDVLFSPFSIIKATRGEDQEEVFTVKKRKTLERAQKYYDKHVTEDETSLVLLLDMLHRKLVLSRVTCPIWQVPLVGHIFTRGLSVVTEKSVLKHEKDKRMHLRIMEVTDVDLSKDGWR